jgi:hypothetical protein
MNTVEIRERAKGWRFWLTRPTVLALCHEVDALIGALDVSRESFQRAAAECQSLERDNQTLRNQLEVAKKGNRVLLGFVHETHRLGTPIQPGTIREILSK